MSTSWIDELWSNTWNYFKWTIPEEIPARGTLTADDNHGLDVNVGVLLKQHIYHYGYPTDEGKVVRTDLFIFVYSWPVFTFGTDFFYKFMNLHTKTKQRFITQIATFVM